MKTEGLTCVLRQILSLWWQVVRGGAEWEKFNGGSAVAGYATPREPHQPSRLWLVIFGLPNPAPKHSNQLDWAMQEW